MPAQKVRRLARAKALISAYMALRKAKNNRTLHRRRIAAQLARQNPPFCQVFRDQSPSLSLSSISSFSDSSTDESSSVNSALGSADFEWSDLLGSDWRSDRQSSLGSFGSITSFGVASDPGSDGPPVPDLVSLTGSDFGDSADGMGDDEMSEGVDGEDDLSDDDDEPRPTLRGMIWDDIQQMYQHRYEEPRTRLPKQAESYLHHVLMRLKAGAPEYFRQELRVSPYTFDCLVRRLEDDPVFTTNSDLSMQTPIEEQVAVALYRFGHDGNAAGLQGTANWAGIGKGTVHDFTRRVMTAVLRPDFRKEAVHFPSEEEKEEAKRWVHKHSCRAWRDGWCFVDGTLVPLAFRPYWFGTSYFDRKSRYSLNIQIVSLPNLRIIDYGYGHVGSTHDATAWEGTRIFQKHDTLLPDGEWIWGDSAYPIQTWVVAPYKAPERDDVANAVFNRHVSILRIRSEHAIGFLKGRFHSLKNLRLRINSAKTHKIATYWVSSCISIHSFAMTCEAKEKAADDDFDDDPFIAEGLSSDDDSDASPIVPSTHLPPRRAPEGSSRRTSLAAGKAHRADIQNKLFRAKEKHVERRRHHRQLD